jgi:hypothetical protein
MVMSPRISTQGTLPSPMPLQAISRSCAISGRITLSCWYAGCACTNCRIQVAGVISCPVARLHQDTDRRNFMSEFSS